MSRNPAKTIIISCDGTSENSNEKDFGRRTNCHKLPFLLKEIINNGRRPVLWTYEEGLGTDRNAARSQGRFMTRVLEKYKQRFSGKGFEEKVIGLYYLVAAHWQEGDDLMLFGFSRGAYVVRILASFIADMRILNRLYYVNSKNKTLNVKRLQEDCDRLFRIWAEGHDSIAEHNGNGVYKEGDYFLDGDISVVGVYDTVASLGDPDTWIEEKQSKQFKFAEPIDKRPAIKHFFQAVALAERRLNFKPRMVDKVGDGQVAVQTWFPFFHSSVGGDVGQPGQRSAQICLLWMISRMLEFGILDETDLEQVKLEEYLLSARGAKPPKQLEDFRYKFPFFVKPGKRGTYKRDKELVRAQRITRESLHVTVSQKGFKEYLGIKKRPEPVDDILFQGEGRGDIREEDFDVEGVTEFEQIWLDKIAGKRWKGESFMEMDSETDS